MRSSFLASLAVAGLVFLLACGGGGGSSTTPPQPDFSLTITAPSNTRVGTGSSTTATVNRAGGHAAALTLTLAANAQAITGNGTIATSASSGTLVLTVPVTATPGAYTLTANASDGSLSRSANFTLTVLPPPNFAAAAVVIGQPNFTSAARNQGGGTPAANTLAGSYGNVTFANGVLYVTDFGNNRILGFNGIPTVSNASANFVLGQQGFTTAASGTAANQMNGPDTLLASNGKLYLCDILSNRVLIWNALPTATGAAASVVIGQPGFGTAGKATTQAGLNFPESLTLAGGRLLVSDSSNNRVLIWNTVPAASGSPADLVLGQGDFTHGTANDDNQDGVSDTSASARTLNYPCGIWSDGTRLIICDGSNNRILIWNTFPTSNFQPANLVIGQSDFAHRARNDDSQSGTNGTAPSARTFNFPYTIDSNGVELFVGDDGNHRVLIFETIPTTNFAPANRVLGQSDFVHWVRNDDNQDGVSDAAPSARTFGGIGGVARIGTQLFVSDYRNFRCLIFNNP